MVTISSSSNWSAWAVSVICRSHWSRFHRQTLWSLTLLSSYSYYIHVGGSVRWPLEGNPEAGAMLHRKKQESRLNTVGSVGAGSNRYRVNKKMKSRSRTPKSGALFVINIGNSNRPWQVGIMHYITCNVWIWFVFLSMCDMWIVEVDALLCLCHQLVISCQLLFLICASCITYDVWILLYFWYVICESVEYDATFCYVTQLVVLCHLLSLIFWYNIRLETDDADEMARLDSNRFHEVVGVLDELHNDGNFSTSFRHARNYVQREYPCDATPSCTSCRIVDVSCFLRPDKCIMCPL